MKEQDIIKDLLNKIDVLQKTIADQNRFVMKMATYHDEREEKNLDKRTEIFLQIWSAADSSGVLKRLMDAMFPTYAGIDDPAEDDAVH